MKCEHKHTKYQPTDEEWRCPSCDSIDFFIDDGPNMECDLIHDDDYIFCNSCKEDESGKSFVSKLLKRKKLVICPHCNGKGMIKNVKTV